MILFQGLKSPGNSTFSSSKANGLYFPNKDGDGFCHRYLLGLHSALPGVCGLAWTVSQLLSPGCRPSTPFSSFVVTSWFVKLIYQQCPGLWSQVLNKSQELWNGWAWERIRWRCGEEGMELAKAQRSPWRTGSASDSLSCTTYSAVLWPLHVHTGLCTKINLSKGLILLSVGT